MRIYKDSLRTPRDGAGCNSAHSLSQRWNNGHVLAQSQVVGRMCRKHWDSRRDSIPNLHGRRLPNVAIWAYQPNEASRANGFQMPVLNQLYRSDTITGDEQKLPLLGHNPRVGR